MVVNPEMFIPDRRGVTGEQLYLSISCGAVLITHVDGFCK